MVNFNTSQNRIYLDHNATTPFCSEILEQIPKWLEGWGNPSSIHQNGRGPKTQIRVARQNVAKVIGAKPQEVVFTSGGGEANNLAVFGTYQAQISSVDPARTGRNKYIISSVEHPTLYKSVMALKQFGCEVVQVPVRRDGQLDLDLYSNALDSKTALVSIMYANNETGNIFPIGKLVKMAREKGALFHCDAVQGLGKAVVDVKKWDLDLASFSSHKFYALKGSGALYVKSGTHIESLIRGGGQERGRRAGTENVLAISAFGAMSGYSGLIEEKAGEMKILRDYLESRVLKEIPGVSVTGGDSKRLPNTSSLIIDGIDGETLLMNLDLKNVSVSTGAACSSGNPEPSPVLLAMGLSRKEAQASLRLSLGWGNTKDQVNEFVEILISVVDRLRTITEEEKGLQ